MMPHGLIGVPMVEVQKVFRADMPILDLTVRNYVTLNDFKNLSARFGLTVLKNWPE